MLFCDFYYTFLPGIYFIFHLLHILSPIKRTILLVFFSARYSTYHAMLSVRRSVHRCFSSTVEIVKKIHNLSDVLTLMQKKKLKMNMKLIVEGRAGSRVDGNTKRLCRKLKIEFMIHQAGSAASTLTDVGSYP